MFGTYPYHVTSVLKVSRGDNHRVNFDKVLVFGDVGTKKNGGVWPVPGVAKGGRVRKGGEGDRNGVAFRGGCGHVIRCSVGGLKGGLGRDDWDVEECEDGEDWERDVEEFRDAYGKGEGGFRECSELPNGVLSKIR